MRERLDDLPLLVEHFLKHSNQEAVQPVRTIAPEAMHLLETYHWPGNVRELQSVVKYAGVHAVGEVITPDCLPESCRGPAKLDRGCIAEELPDFVRFVGRLVLAAILRCAASISRRSRTHGARQWGH